MDEQTVAGVSSVSSLLDASLNMLCDEWAEDHTHLQNLCREVGYSEDEIEGNSYGVPGIQDLADMLRAKIPPPLKFGQAISEACAKLNSEM